MSTLKKDYTASIYVLMDISENIFYVGQTIGLVKDRFNTHMRDASIWKKNIHRISEASKKDKKIISLNFKILCKIVYIKEFKSVDKITVTDRTTIPHLHKLKIMKELLELIELMNKNMAEQFMRHDYLSMYDIWQMVSAKAKEVTPTTLPTGKEIQAMAEKEYPPSITYGLSATGGINEDSNASARYAYKQGANFVITKIKNNE